LSAASAAAVSYGHLEIAKLLLERGADPNITDNDNDTPLHVCETVECAELLLAANARLDAVNSAGQQVRGLLIAGAAMADHFSPPPGPPMAAGWPGLRQPHETAYEDDRVEVEALLRQKLGLPPSEPKEDRDMSLQRLLEALEHGGEDVNLADYGFEVVDADDDDRSLPDDDNDDASSV